MAGPAGAPPESPAPGDVPVMLDALRDLEGVEMARSSYFVVTSLGALPARVAPEPDGSELEVLLVGGTGILHRPLSGGRRFRHPAQIAEVFDLLTGEELLIEIEDVWLPVAWLPGGHEPARDDVYRVALPAFRAAWRYRIGSLGQADLLALDAAGMVSFSEDETAALEAWLRQQLEEARSLYPKADELALPWRADTTG